MNSGVLKSGCPMPRLMTSRPCAINALARANTAKAFSSPIRSKAAMVRSMEHSNCLCGAISPILEAKSNRLPDRLRAPRHMRQQIALGLGQTRNSRKLHRAHKLVAQMFEHRLHAIGAVGCKAPQDRPADQH